MSDDTGKSDDPYHMRPLWDTLVEVYEVYAEICNRHQLRYYVCAGTILGALRHRGFIPWDDDFDVIMPRQDYERFLEIAPKELPSHLKIIDRHNTPEFHLLFAKVQDCRKEKVEQIEKDIGHILSDGIFVDVFPLDGYPNWGFSQKFLKRRERVFEWCCYYQELKASPQRKLTLRQRIRFFLGCVFSFLSNFAVERENIAEAHLKRYSFSDTAWSAAGGCLVGMFERVIPPNVWGDPRIVPFDKIMVPIPQQAEKLMQICYGDYMKLPPPEKRRSTHVFHDAIHVPWWLGPTRTSKR